MSSIIESCFIVSRNYLDKSSFGCSHNYSSHPNYSYYSLAISIASFITIENSLTNNFSYNPNSKVISLISK